MRKLGRGQSVSLMVPAETRRKITALCHMPEDSEIGVADVLCWSISETWQEFRKLAPLWVAQGVRHQRQTLLWESVKRPTGCRMTFEVACQFLEKESRTLEERYRPDRQDSGRTDASPVQPVDLARRAAQLALIQDRCASLGIGDGLVGPSPRLAKLGVAGEGGLREERERELSAEAEEERQIERPLAVEPLVPTLHPDVKRFVMKGVIRSGTKAIQPALGTLANSSFGDMLSRLRLRLLPGDGELLVTADFARTVKLPTSMHKSDAYYRPVQWIATAPAKGTGNKALIMVILSPGEANALLPALQSRAATATLHLFAPRTQLATRSAEDLTLYTTPPLPAGWGPPSRTQILLLLLFAGQLYLRSFSDYLAIRRMLGIPCSVDANGEDGEDDDEQQDNRRKKSDEAANANLSLFYGLVWHIRHDCADISKTDVGRLLTNHVLTPDMFLCR